MPGVTPRGCRSSQSAGCLLALIDGAPGAIWAQGGRRVVFAFTIAGEKIVAIDLIADPEHLGRLDLEMLAR
jgi:hypothetical protein